MLGDQAFEHLLCGLSLVLVELLQGFELQAEGVILAAFVFVKLTL